MAFEKEGRGFLASNGRRSGGGDPAWRLRIHVGGRDRDWGGWDDGADGAILLYSGARGGAAEGALHQVAEASKRKPTWPDVRGDLRIDGTAWEVAGWKKEGREGVYGVRLSPPRIATATTTAAPAAAAGGETPSPAIDDRLRVADIFPDPFPDA